MALKPERKELTWERALEGIILASVLACMSYSFISLLRGAPLLSAAVVVQLAAILTIIITSICYFVMRLLTGISAPNGWVCTISGVAIGLIFPITLFYNYTIDWLFFPIDGAICGYLFFHYYCRPAR